MANKPLSTLVIAGLLLTACGGGSTPDDTPTDPPTTSIALEDREFWSTSAIAGSAPLVLVDGTRIQMSFGADTFGASAGCNAMGGRYLVTDEDRLVVSELAMTEMGCDPARHEQDEWLVAFLMSSPQVEIDGNELTLSSDDAVVELLDREVADPDMSLVGTRWVVTGFISGEAATNLSVPNPAYLEFDDVASQVTGFDGCNTIAGSVEIADGSTGGPVEGDGEFQFGPIEGEQELCEGYEQYQPMFHAVFEAGQATYTINGPNLTIMSRDGTGMTLRAE